MNANASSTSGRRKRWPSKPLRDKVSTAAAGRPIRGQRVEVSFMVEGGAPGERFYECVVIDSDGNVLYETEDKLRRRRRRKVSRQLDPDRLKAAFATVRACARLEYKGFAGQIVPGTLVGFLRAQSGKKEETVYFPLEEAETVRRRMAAPSRLRLHSGKELAVLRGAVPRQFITAAESINKVAKLLGKAEVRC